MIDRKQYQNAVDQIYSMSLHFSVESLIDDLLDGGTGLAEKKQIRNKMRIKRAELMTAWDNASESERQQLAATLTFDPSVLT